MPKLHAVKGVQYNLHMQVEVSTSKNVPVIKVVPCLDCGAGLGEKCVTAKGEPKVTPCMSRRRLAIRNRQT